MIVLVLGAGDLVRHKSGTTEIVKGVTKLPFPSSKLHPALVALKPNTRVPVRFLEDKVAQVLSAAGRWTSDVVVWPDKAVPPEVVAAIKELNAASAEAPVVLPVRRVSVQAVESPAPRKPGIVPSEREARRLDRGAIGIGAFFANPYNFVPFPPRLVNGTPLSDAPPVGHDRFRPGLLSARLRVIMTLETPLLLADGARARDHQGGDPEHSILPVRRRGAFPIVPQTSVRGMLRAAYEAITNSRLPFLPSHDSRLGYRMPAEEALGMVPARVERDPATTGLRLRLLPGSNLNVPRFDRSTGRFDVGHGAEMYAAWLPAYNSGPNAPTVRRYPDGTLPQHGDAVFFTLSNQLQGQGFRYRTVETIRPASVAERAGSGEFAGYVCITHRNNDRKTYERVFFRDPAAAASAGHRQLPDTIPLPPAGTSVPDLLGDWALLMKSGVDANAARIDAKLERVSASGGGTTRHDRLAHYEVGNNNKSDINKIAISRHLCPEQGETLGIGSLVYVRFDRYAHEAVVGLSPVMIGRDLYLHPPSRFVDQTIKPATRLAELSPADRVFGWVRQSRGESTDIVDASAYRGQLRIGPVRLAEGQRDVIEEFTQRPQGSQRHHDAANGLPIAVLGQPKPQQARFYAAANGKGAALPDGVPKRFGYSDPATQGLRGRKVYPHHRLAAGARDYWTPPAPVELSAMQAITGQGAMPLYREYLRPAQTASELRDSQNRSVEGWVKRGTRFTFDITVTNLSPAEMGALLWLLDLPSSPDCHFHRLGGGKPLGFGSVRLELDKAASALLDDAAMAKRYASPLGHAAEPAWSDDRLSSAVAAYKAALCDLLGGPSFDEQPVIRAFLNAAKGPNWPVHYPRVLPDRAPAHSVPPDPKGESFQWFVQNEGNITGENGKGTKNTKMRNGREVEDSHPAPAQALPAGWSQDTSLAAYRRKRQS